MKKTINKKTYTTPRATLTSLQLLGCMLGTVSAGVDPWVDGGDLARERHSSGLNFMNNSSDQYNIDWDF